MARATLLIATRNRAEQLRLGLESIMAQKYKDLDVIVIDDASEDDTSDVVFGFGGCAYHRIERDGGYRHNPGRVLNLGHALCKTEIVIEQGGEVCHLTDCVSPLVSACRPKMVALARVHNGEPREMEKLRIAIASGIYPFPTDIVPATVKTDAEHWRVPKVDPIGCDLFCGAERQVPFLFLGAIHKSDFDSVNGYNEAIPTKNDTDLANRLLSKNVMFRFVGKAVAFHVKHGKT